MSLKRLDELCDLQSDAWRPGASVVGQYLALEDLNSGRYYPRGRSFQPDLLSTKTRFRIGDVLYGKLRPYLDKAVIAESDGICSTEMLVLRPKEGITPEYLVSLLHSKQFLEYAKSTTTGVNHPRTTWPAIARYEWDVPDPQSMANAGVVLAFVQRTMDTVGVLLNSAQVLKSATMVHLFTHGLGGEPLKETDTGLVPESWGIASLGALCETPEYGFTDSAQQEPVGPRFLRITDITDDGVDWSTVPYCRCPDLELARKQLAEGDIVVARIGATTGKSFRVTSPPSAVFASYLIRLRVREGLDSRFLSQWMQSPGYWEQINSQKDANFKGGVNSMTLASLKLPLPSPEQQVAIASALEVIDEVISMGNRKLVALRALFGSLLAGLMTGDLLVPNSTILSQVEVASAP